MRRLHIISFLVTCLLACVPTSATAATSPRPVNNVIVYIDPPRGGFGDVASNIMMIEKLKEERPTASIRVVVSREAEPLLAKMLPDYRPGIDKQQVRIGQHRFTMFPYSALESISPTPVSVSFSTNGQDQSRMASKSTYRVGYHEYSDITWKDAESWTVNGKLQQSITRAHPSGSVMFNTGGQSNGYYISRSPNQQSPLTRSQLAGFLRKLDGVTIPDAFSPDRGALLATAYSKRKRATEIYLAGLAKAARNSPLSNQVILCVVKDHPGLEIPRLPPNVHLVKYKTTSYDVSKALIAHSDLPLLATGDGSLSLAMDYEKVFFYESNSWKNLSSMSLIEELAGSSSYFGEPRQKARLERALMIEPIVGDVEPNEVARLFGDRQYQHEFRAAIRQIRGKSALAPKVWQHIDLLRQVEFDRVNVDVLVPMMKALNEGVDPGQVSARLNAMIRDSSLPPEQRLQSASSLLARVDWDTPDAFQSFFSLIEDRSPYMRGVGRDFFLDGLTNDPERFERIFEAALSRNAPSPTRAAALKILTSAAAILELGEDPRGDHRRAASRFILNHPGLVERGMKRDCSSSVRGLLLEILER